MIRKPSPYLLGIISALLVCLPTLGCTAAQIRQAVSATVTGLTEAQKYFPAARTIVSDVSLANPAVGAQLALLESQGEQAVAKLIAVGNNWLASPSDSLYQELLTGVESILTQANAETLKQLRVSNPESQKQVTAWIQVFVTALTVVDVLLRANAKKSQLQTVPTKTATLDELRPLLDRGYAVSLLDRMGYTGEQVVSQAGF